MGRLEERYELLAEVADGPVAKVHRGVMRGDAGFTRPVAVRELHPRYAKDPGFVGTWSAEAAELAALGGSNVERVLDVIVDDARVFVISEWVEGISLRRWLGAAGDRPLEWPLVARIGVGVLHALEAPHARTPPLLHLGITTAAVRVSEGGAVKLMRYGAPAALAAAGAGRREMQAAGAWHGAPEILDGEAPSPASDQLGVGALLYELLASEPAFAGDAKLAAGEAGDLAALRDDVPPLLVAHIERALRLDPNGRFASAAEMARALEQLVRTSSEEADRASLARGVAEARERGGVKRTQIAGPKALAASVRAMAGLASGETEESPSKVPTGLPETEAKLPQGLPENRTMAVSITELKEIPVGDTLPPDEPTDPKTVEATADEAEDKKRYKFKKKERSATKKSAEEKSLGLAPQESEAAPLPLTKSKRPMGLSPNKTEFLDGDEVDRLKIGKSPLGLAANKTEFLDGEQVDRLTLENIPSAKKKKKRKKKKTGEAKAGEAKPKKKKKAKSKKPMGLSPNKTEFLDESQVDRLKIDD